MDRMTVIARDGSSCYLIEGDEVLDLRDHVHQPTMIDGELRCSLCNQLVELEGDEIGN